MTEDKDDEVHLIKFMTAKKYSMRIYDAGITLHNNISGDESFSKIELAPGAIEFSEGVAHTKLRAATFQRIMPAPIYYSPQTNRVRWTPLVGQESDGLKVESRRLSFPGYAASWSIS